MLNKRELGLAQRLRAISNLIIENSDAIDDSSSLFKCELGSADVELLQRLCLGKTVEGDELKEAERLMNHAPYKSVLDIPKHFALDAMWMDLVTKAVINQYAIDGLSATDVLASASAKVKKNHIHQDQCKAISDMLIAAIGHANSRPNGNIDLSDILYTILLENGDAVKLTGLPGRTF